MKKYIVTISILLFSFTNLEANNFKADNVSNWKIVTGDNSYYIQKLDKETKMYQISSIGGVPKVTEILKKEEAPQYIFVIYYAGSAGTTAIVTSYRAVIFKQESNKFIADIPYKYSSDQIDEIIQPTWSFTNQKLTVYDDSDGSRQIIDLR